MRPFNALSIEWAINSNHQTFGRVIVKEKKPAKTFLEIIIRKAELDENFVKSLVLDEDY